MLCITELHIRILTYGENDYVSQLKKLSEEEWGELFSLAFSPKFQSKLQCLYAYGKYCKDLTKIKAIAFAAIQQKKQLSQLLRFIFLEKNDLIVLSKFIAAINKPNFGDEPMPIIQTKIYRHDGMIYVETNEPSISKYRYCEDLIKECCKLLENEHMNLLRNMTVDMCQNNIEEIIPFFEIARYHFSPAIWNNIFRLAESNVIDTWDKYREVLPLYWKTNRWRHNHLKYEDPSYFKKLAKFENASELFIAELDKCSNGNILDSYYRIISIDDIPELIKLIANTPNFSKRMSRLIRLNESCLLSAKTYKLLKEHTSKELADIKPKEFSLTRQKKFLSELHKHWRHKRKDMKQKGYCKRGDSWSGFIFKGGFFKHILACNAYSQVKLGPFPLLDRSKQCEGVKMLFFCMKENIKPHINELFEQINTFSCKYFKKAMSEITNHKLLKFITEEIIKYEYADPKCPTTRSLYFDPRIEFVRYLLDKLPSADANELITKYNEKMCFFVTKLIENITRKFEQIDMFYSKEKFKDETRNDINLVYAFVNKYTVLLKSNGWLCKHILAIAEICEHRQLIKLINNIPVLNFQHSLFAATSSPNESFVDVSLVCQV